MTGTKGKGWLVLIAGVIGLFGLTALAGRQLNPSFRSSLTCCVDDTRTGGARGLVLWAQRLNLPVQPLRLPIWEVADSFSHSTGNCVLTAGDGAWSPQGEPLTAEQWANLKLWIERGNTLLVLTTMPERLPDPLQRFLLGTPASGAAASTKDNPPVRWLAEDVSPAPETEDISTPWGGHLTVRADGPRWRNGQGNWRIAAGVNGAVLCRIPVGRGAFYLMLDDFAWTNAGFDRGENAQVLAAVLARELQDGAFGFDEYRHGHGRIESFVSFLLAAPGASNFLEISMVLALLYLVGRNVRFGPPDPYELPERRTSREYIEAMAQLYERARAAPLAVGAVVSRVRQLAAQRGQLPPEMAAALAKAQDYAAHRDRPTKPTEACRLVTNLIGARKHSYGAARISPWN
jgi:hypothetical protein